MPLNAMQVRCDKPEAKACTLGDGQGLSLLIEPNGSKSWRFRYRYAGKPKMISLGVYPTITLADARSRRDEARKLIAPMFPADVFGQDRSGKLNRLRAY